MSFLASGGTAPRVLIILAVGVLLLVLGDVSLGTQEPAREEEKIAELCSMTEGVGECRVMVTYSPEGDEVYAVAVLCNGGESAEIRGRITAMICSLYGIGSNRVSVMKLANSKKAE